MNRLLFCFSVLLLVAGLGGCSDSDDDTDANDAGDTAMGDAATTAPTVDSGPPPPPEPMFSFDGSIPDSSAPFCSLLVGAECDGDEDCSGGQVCCGDFNMGTIAYDAIKCQDTCDPLASQYKLCHEGEPCPTEGRVCEHSVIIPYDDYAVCKEPTGMADPVVGGNAPGEINCGAAVCGSGEKCCLRVLIDLSNGLPDSGVAGLAELREVLDPYCAALEDDCQCDLGGDNDAGSDDAG
jgi:hypothetical protein